MKLLKPLAAVALATAFAATPALAREDNAPDPFMIKYDMDKDGMMSKKEVMDMMEKMFEKHDTKKMGKLEKAQLSEFLRELSRSEGSAAPFMANHDMDKDGMMSKKEVMDMMGRMFDKHDTKKTGKLDKTQFEHFLKELMKGEG